MAAEFRAQRAEVAAPGQRDPRQPRGPRMSEDHADLELRVTRARIDRDRAENGNRKRCR
jgi:hypothetical protein